MKKILVITYYWPPSGGVGAQRWLKFAKYLRNYDWEPIIFTPENPDFDVKDTSGEKDVPDDIEVLKLPIWEPYQLFRSLKRNSKNTKLKQGLVLENSNKSWFDKLSIWLRGNVILPDPRRFWVRPAVAFLDNIIESNNIDVVVTTGPPHSMHFIGQRIRKNHDVKWLADFRDPWSHWDLLDKLKTSSFARRLHKKWERRVLLNADFTLLTSKRQARQFKELGAQKVGCITNGYDEDDCPEFMNVASSKFVLSHIGLLNEMRNPKALLNALEELCNENSDFCENLELRLGGIISESIIENINKSSSLNNCTTILDYVPHSDIYKEYERATILLLILNNTDNSNWILPAKLFEYIYTKKPVLMLGEIESDAADITHSFQENKVVEFNDKENIKRAILSYYQQFKKGTILLNLESNDMYSRKHLTQDLVDVLNDLVMIK
jgi:glycosyltransferase involved in cell wall biosynthesis